MSKAKGGMPGFHVQRRMCATCIYRPDSPHDIKKLEDQVRDPHIGFKGHRQCHHSKRACCRGFWNRHKDEFPAGQIAQRLSLVVLVDDDTMPDMTSMKRKTMAKAKKKTPNEAAIDTMLDEIRQAVGRCTVPSEREVYEALMGEAAGWEMRLGEIDAEDEEEPE